MAKFKAFDGKELNINNFYRNQHGFLVVNGPSLNDVDKSLLTQPGIMTLGVNNGPAAFRPNLWIMADDNTSFIRSIWLDPRIVKFVPEGKKGKKLFHNDEFKEMETSVGDCSSIVYYERNYKFEPEKWLHQDSLNWGNKTHICGCGYEHKQIKDKDGNWKKPPDKICPKCGDYNRFGHYNIIYLAVGLMFHLGFRTLNIVGADFHMDKGHTYAFDQARSRNSIKNNNAQYEEANKRFDALKPHFEKHGYNVFNCYEDSGLKSFPYKSLEQAVSDATENLPPAVTDKWGVWRCQENTKGLYDRKANEKQKKKDKRGKGEMTIDEFLRMKGVA